MLVGLHFDPPQICLHDGGSIYLVPRIASTGIFGSRDRFIGPPDRFRGDRIPRDTVISRRLIKHRPKHSSYISARLCSLLWPSDNRILFYI